MREYCCGSCGWTGPEEDLRSKLVGDMRLPDCCPECGSYQIAEVDQPTNFDTLVDIARERRRDEQNKTDV